MGLVFCLTVSSLAGAYIVSVLYLKPLIKSVEKVLAEADVAAKDLDTAAKVTPRERQFSEKLRRRSASAHAARPPARPDSPTPRLPPPRRWRRRRC